MSYHETGSMRRYSGGYGTIDIFLQNSSDLNIKEKYDYVYSCMVAGYTKAIEKTEELGRKEVNAHKIYIKFDCYEDSTNKTPASNKPIEKAISSINIRQKVW